MVDVGAVQQDKLVVRGLSLLNGHAIFGQVESLCQNLDERFVGLAFFRRGGYGDLESAVEDSDHSAAGRPGHEP